MFDYSFPELPVSEVIPDILLKLESNTRIVLEAPPGAGKTSLIPLALLKAKWRGANKILILEPRRIAARSAASRMAEITGTDLGILVGYRVRLENKITETTKIEVVTEGILTRMIQDDPALEGIAAIIFDEFHERNLQADLGLAFALNCQALLRPDLRIIIMSATIDAEAIGLQLKADIIKSPGRSYPVTLQYLLPEDIKNFGSGYYQRITSLVPKAVLKALHENTEGDVLVFLPGLGEIKKIASILEKLIEENIEIHLLHGDLSLQQQQLAIKPSSSEKRKIILSTSIAETSITIEGVKMVIDAGYSRISQFIARSGLTTLVTVPVSKAAANQRSGRAGRTSPGHCIRLWTTMEHLQKSNRHLPEILEADLTSLALELAIWGVQNVTDLQWIDVPPTAALAQARDLLVQLEAITPEGKVLQHGKQMAFLGLHPRLSHMIIKAQHLNLSTTACVFAAILSEKDFIIPKHIHPENKLSISSDVRLRLEVYMNSSNLPVDMIAGTNTMKRIKKQADVLIQKINKGKEAIEPDAAGKLVALAYPERVAQLEPNRKVRLRSGQKLTFDADLFEKSEFFAVAHLDAQKDKIFLAAPISKNDLKSLFSDQVKYSEDVFWDKIANRVSSKRLSTLGALTLDESSVKEPDQEIVVDVLISLIKEEGISIIPWSAGSLNLQKRMLFLNQLDPDNWPDVSDDNLIESINDWLRPYLYGKRSLDDLRKLDMHSILLNLLPFHQQQELEILAPTHVEVPSGSKIAIDYTNIASPVLSVRLQEVFGMLETPKIAQGKVSLLMHLLSPAGRPVQITQDLNSFWKNGYFEVRKDLRARYSKHAWPDDPLAAKAIRGTKKRG